MTRDLEEFGEIFEKDDFYYYFFFFGLVFYL